MASDIQEYSVEQEVASFFSKTSTTRSACDARAVELVGGSIAPVAVQGACSYTLYAGPNHESVVQFRLKSLALPLKTADLARQIYGSLVPAVSFEGQLGENTEGKEALYIYVMSRIQGMSRLDFILAYGFPEDTLDNRATRVNLVTDIARFFALAWRSALNLDQARLEDMRKRYGNDLRRLLPALPPRFRPIIRASLEAIPSIMSLPMVLLHKDFGDCNIIVEDKTCHLAGVIDWAEAEIGPFGLNFYSVQQLMGKYHLRKGWLRYVDYDVLDNAFWHTLRANIEDLSNENVSAIKSAMVVGLLLSHGFTSRLGNMTEPVPIRDDSSARGSLIELNLTGQLDKTTMVGPRRTSGYVEDEIAMVLG